MKTLTLYILKSTILPFLLGFGGFLLYANVFILIDISSQVIMNNLSFWRIFPFLFYQLPRYIPQAIPVGVLMSIFWLFSKMSSNNELIALQVHGIKLKKIFIPFLILGIFLSGITFILKEAIVPELYRNRDAEVYLSSGLHKFQLMEDNRYMFIKRVYSNRKELLEVFIYDLSNDTTTVFYSPKIQYNQEKAAWDLSQMVVYRRGETSKMEPQEPNEKQKELIAADVDFYFQVTSKKPENMSSQELWSIIKENKRRNLDNKESYKFETQFHTRYAESFGPLVVAFLGVPLSLALGIKSKAWSVIFTFLLIALYQGSTQWMAAMGRSDTWSPWHLNPVFASWGPNIFFVSIGLVFLILLDTEKLYRFKEFISNGMFSSLGVFSE